MTEVTILGDPILDPYGVNRVTIFLANFFSRSYDVEVVAARIAEKVRPQFQSGIKLAPLGERLWAKSPSTAFGESWLREALARPNGRAWTRRRCSPGGLVVNLSNTIVAPADVWYLQGPVGLAISLTLRQMVNGLGPVVSIADPVLDLLDHHQITRTHAATSIHVANSEYCRSSYSPYGISVERVIYPPLDTEVFRPATANPSEDYCVAYLGKETDPRMLVALADNGVRIRAFGSKLGKGAMELERHANITLVGRLGDRELSQLYSHAKMTIFPFTVEPFGYVPVESMACGTPVLTYDQQGPAETTEEGRTGWRCHGEAGMIRRAKELWSSSGISREMRERCAQSAARYSVENIGREWTELLRQLSSRKPRSS